MMGRHSSKVLYSKCLAMLRRKKSRVMFLALITTFFFLANKELQKQLASISTQVVYDQGFAELLFVRSDDPEACTEWRYAYPASLVVVVGANTVDATNSRQCIYTGNMTSAFAILTLTNPAGRPVVVTDDSPSSKSCVQRVVQHAAVAASSRYRIVYNNSDTIYNSSRHFGCGGTTGGLNSTGSYSFCKRPASLGPMVGVYGEGRVCDNVYPSMSLAPGVHALARMQCAWVPETSLWMLPFLGGSSGINEVARTMLAEKLLWYSGYRVQVAPHISSQGSRVLVDELGSKFMKIIAAALSDVSCNGTRLEECSLQMAERLLHKGYLGTNDTELFHKWSSMLRYSEYGSHAFQNLSEQECVNRAVISHMSPDDERTRLDVNKERRKYIQNGTCTNFSQSTDSHNFADPWLQYKDILLIVTLNSRQHYDMIPYYETLYRQFFPHMLYCGPGSNFTKGDLNMTSFSFVGYQVTLGKASGALHYECLIQASGLGYNVKGYLQSSDDIFLNMHRLRHNDVNKAWFYQLNNLQRVDTFNHTFCEGDKCRPDVVLDKFWHKFHNETFSAFTELNSLQTPAAKRCNANREKYFGGIDWHVRVLSDTTYIPTRYVEDVSSILEVFLRSQLYLEIALPTALTCIIPQHDIDPIYMDLHNLEKPSTARYSHLILKPSNPDLVVFSLIGRNDLFKYLPMYEPYMYLTPQHMQGMSIFHRFKLSFIWQGVDRHVRLFCDVMNFLGDPDGDADKHITRHDWPPGEVSTIGPPKPKPTTHHRRKKGQKNHQSSSKKTNTLKQFSKSKNRTKMTKEQRKKHCWHTSPTVIKCRNEIVI